MKRVLSFGCLALSIVFLLAGCSRTAMENDTYFIGTWDGQNNNVLQLCADGTYELGTQSSGDRGTYKIKGETITFVSDVGNEYEHRLFLEKYVLRTAYDGEIPQTDKFSVTVRNEERNAGVVMEFSEDGTVTRQIYITNVSNQRISGTYTREEEKITCDFQIFGVFSFIVCDGVLYDAYELDADYVPPTQVPSATPTATGGA